MWPKSNVDCRFLVLTAPHSPRRHQKLNLRMKSFSLDESGEHFHHHGSMSVGSGHSHGCGPPNGHHRSSNPNAATTTTTTSSSGTLNSNSAHNSQASFYCQCKFRISLKKKRIHYICLLG
jgi:hypothetical protein